MRHIPLAVSLLAAGLGSAEASFHLFDIQEIYSNADGSVQFIELFTTQGNQQFLNGHTVRFEIGGVITNSVNLSTQGSDSAGKTVLLATSNVGALYGITPDFVIPASFFTQGASHTVNFAEGTDLVNLASLPLDGTRSLNGVIGNGSPTVTSINQPQVFATNYAGVTMPIPEPGVPGLFAAAGLLGLVRRRRVASSQLA